MNRMMGNIRRVFQMNNSGFHAEITLEKENLVLFHTRSNAGIQNKLEITNFFS